MNSNEFRKFAFRAIDTIVDYLEQIRDRKVLPNVQPGYLYDQLPGKAPNKSENWEKVLKDIDKLILPGLTHWHSPHFHAYYPTANSYPAVVAEIITTGLGTVSLDEFPDSVSINLELKVMDWLAKLINLPPCFWNSSSGPGGGLLQNSASDSTLLALLAAKTKKTAKNLVAYTSEQSNSSVEKSGLLGSVTFRLLPTDPDGSLRVSSLLNAIHEDLRAGLTPCAVIATLGTTGTCAFDNLSEIGPICAQFELWLHVDAAYAGAAFCCSEFTKYLEGVEFADSFCFNPHKWMLMNSDCSALWLKDTRILREDFQWQVGDERKFRSLKVWFVLRIYGVKGVRDHIRRQVFLASLFEGFVRQDERFEVCRAALGLVCFRLKGGNDLTENLLAKVAERRNIFIMPYYFQGVCMIRFVICSRFTEEGDIVFAWNEILGQI